MNISNATRLTYAVSVLCPEIAQRAQSNAPILDEERLWWELCSCLLSSQVPYDLATAATDAILRDGCLTDAEGTQVNIEARLTKILHEGFRAPDGRTRRHRFGQSRARQIAGTRAAIHAKFGSLSNLIKVLHEPLELRQWLVDSAPGLGPKQASMFLRNIGVSYDLAVLDRHVLRYMQAIGLDSPAPNAISRLAHYRRHESALRSHADHLGVAVGLLDWAIWIVMRADQGMFRQGVLL